MVLLNVRKIKLWWRVIVAQNITPCKCFFVLNLNIFWILWVCGPFFSLWEIKVEEGLHQESGCEALLVSNGNEWWGHAGVSVDYNKLNSINAQTLIIYVNILTHVRMCTGSKNSGKQSHMNYAAA